MRPITDSRAEGLPIGELSRRTGVNIETIRYYERIKMLPTPARTEGGRRVMGQTNSAPSPSSGVRASWGSVSMTSVRFST